MLTNQHRNTSSPSRGDVNKSPSLRSVMITHYADSNGLKAYFS